MLATGPFPDAVGAPDDVGTGVALLATEPYRVDKAGGGGEPG